METNDKYNYTEGDMSDIREIKERQEQHGEVLRCLKKSVTRMETALMGDEKAGVEGVVKRVNRHGDYIRESKKRYAYGAGFVAGIVAIWEAIKQVWL